MPITHLTAADLRLTIDPDSLGFADTSHLVAHPLSWIGQERAEIAASFGLDMEQSDYNLFVLGEVGSGRSSLLKQGMQAIAGQRPTPPDLCYLHNFETPEQPKAIRLPAGQGKVFRQRMERMVKTLLTDIPQYLNGPDFKVESEHIIQSFKHQETRAFAALEAFAEERRFIMRRESGTILFTLRDADGHAMAEEAMLALPKEERHAIDQAEQELLAAINRYFETTRPLEQIMEEALAALRRQVVQPLLDREFLSLPLDICQQEGASQTFEAYVGQVRGDILDNLELFQPSESEDEERKEALHAVLARYRVNLIVDNGGLSGAPVIIEDNPLFRSLFGSIEYQTVNDVLVTDFTRIRAGSLHRAHGGFLMLHLRDLIADGLVWEKMRRFLRSGRLQIEEPGTAFAPIAAVSLNPEPVDLNVKIVLIGSRSLYYELQDGDPEFARRFRVKVDFADRFVASEAARHASAVFVARTCQRLGLPHFSAAAVARLLEQGHREAEDQSRQSALFGQTESLIMESATLCRGKARCLVTAEDVEAALKARRLRHDYPEQRVREAIVEGDVLISVDGVRVGQVNGLSVVDLGDHRFGYPVRVTARTSAGEEGLINIEREVALSGPIHDKGVFILHSYLSALFARNAPLALNASIVFEQEYGGIEGDSASCAELYAILSSLAGVGIRQNIAVTGALNQHGEVLPVGGVNEKIEGFFQVCAAAGLDGSQGVLLPQRNRRHLMLSPEVVDAVSRGLFHIHTITEVDEGLAMLTGLPAGLPGKRGLFGAGSLLHLAQKTLLGFRRACQAHDHRDPEKRHLRTRTEHGN